MCCHPEGKTHPLSPIPLSLLVKNLFQSGLHQLVTCCETKWRNFKSTIINPLYTEFHFLQFFLKILTPCSVQCQLLNGTNYRTEEYGKISREYWVLLRECVLSARLFTSGRCIAHSARQFCAIYRVSLTTWWQMLPILRKNGIDWSFRSSKLVEKV